MRRPRCHATATGAVAHRARPRLLVAWALACGAAHAQTAAPLLEPKPVFTPGLYETESRNSAFQDKPAKSTTCVPSADYDAFRDETMAQYRASPQFVKDCRLSDTRTIKNGFAFAMQCKGTKTVLTYEFGKDLVRGTIETLIEAAPKYSSSILIMMRRVGDCPGQKSGRPL
ncbi:MAG TPA: DUF3617 family protein [Xanthobacteraceae bacterium]|nr:DUF3617 family protein [Xanthobacteraceae bacterium]